MDPIYMYWREESELTCEAALWTEVLRNAQRRDQKLASDVLKYVENKKNAAPRGYLAPDRSWLISDWIQL